MSETCSSVEVVIDVTFSIGALIAALYTCAHAAVVVDLSPYFVGPGVDYASVGRAEHLQRVGEYLAIAGWAQFVAVASVVAIVVHRWKRHWPMLALMVVGLFIAFFSALTSIVLVAIGTIRLNTDIPKLMSESMQNVNSTYDLTVNNASGTINETASPVGVDWNRLQFELQCCGISGYSDYDSNSESVAWIPRSPGVIAPLSCCRRVYDSSPYPGTPDDYRASCAYNGTNPTDYYTQGCQDLMLFYVNDTETVVVVLSCFLMALVLTSNVIRCIRGCVEDKS